MIRLLKELLVFDFSNTDNIDFKIALLLISNSKFKDQLINIYKVLLVPKGADIIYSLILEKLHDVESKNL